MDKAYAAQQEQQAHYEKTMQAMRARDGLFYGAGLGLPGEIASSIAPPPEPPLGVIAMTERAHEAFVRLSRAMSELKSHLDPLVEPYSLPPSEDCPNKTCEASAVACLRLLVQIIEERTAEIYALNAALRV